MSITEDKILSYPIISHAPISLSIADKIVCVQSTEVGLRGVPAQSPAVLKASASAAALTRPRCTVGGCAATRLSGSAIRRSGNVKQVLAIPCA